MAHSRRGFIDIESITGVGWLALVLVFITGILHVYSGLVEGSIPVLLAGVGFLGAIVLYLADYRRRLLYLVGIVYTGVQIPIWYVGKAGAYTMIGYVDKAVQVVLILLLTYLYWRSKPASDVPGGVSGMEQTG